MTLDNNQVVQLRNGICGIVTSFKNQPCQLIFTAYTNPVSRYDENLKHKNSQYDIVKIFDGSSIENPKQVFTKKFDPSSLPLVWSE